MDTFALLCQIFEFCCISVSENEGHPLLYCLVLGGTDTPFSYVKILILFLEVIKGAKDELNIGSNLEEI